MWPRINCDWRITYSLHVGSFCSNMCEMRFELTISSRKDNVAEFQANERYFLDCFAQQLSGDVNLVIQEKAALGCLVSVLRRYEMFVTRKCSSSLQSSLLCTYILSFVLRSESFLIRITVAFWFFERQSCSFRFRVTFVGLAHEVCDFTFV